MSTTTGHGAFRGARRARVQHLVDRYLQSVLLSEYDHAERIANENDIHAGFIEQTRSRIVVRRQASNFL